MSLARKPAHLGGLFKTITEVNSIRTALTALAADAGSGTGAGLAAVVAEVDAIQSDAAMVAGPTTLANEKLLTKAVIRKVLAVAAGPNATTVNVAHGVTLVAGARITKCDFTLSNGTNRLCFGQGGMLADTLAHSIVVAIDGTNVSLTSGSGGDYSLYAGSLILEYTNS